MTSQKRRERWYKALHDKAINIIIGSAEEPTVDDGFVAMTLIDHKGKHHQFVVTHSLKEFLNRERKYVEFFSTDSQGRKTGVSFEWRTRDEVFTMSSDETLHAIRKMVAGMVEENPAIAREPVWFGDYGAGMIRDYDQKND